MSSNEQQTQQEQPSTAQTPAVEQQPAQPMLQQPAQPQHRSVTVIEAIQEYMKHNRLKIVIGTPCYGGLVHIGYFRSMCELTANFTRLGVPFDVMSIGNESLIPRARNGIVAKFMGDVDATHLMFIDADITFNWQTILKLVLMNRDLSGGCYPKKMINWDKVRANLQQDAKMADDILMGKSLDYVFNPVYHVEDQKLMMHVDNGMVKVKDIGTGFMLIKREVFEIMMYKHKDRQYRNNVSGYGDERCDDYFYTLFDTQIDPTSRVYLSEDYLFCKLWAEQGGDCWLDLGINLNHTGTMDFKGALQLTIGQFDNLNKDYQMAQAQNQRKQQAPQPAQSVNTTPAATPSP